MPRRTSAAALLIALAVVASSAGCAASAAAADPLTTVTTLVARPTALELRDDAGTVVRSLDYLGDAGEASDALAVVFGEAAVDQPYAASGESPAGVLHIWAGTFELDERLYDEQARIDRGLVDDLAWPRFTVRFSAREAGAVSLTTESGAGAGDLFADLGSADGGQETCSGWAAEAGEPAADGSVYAVSLTKWAADDAAGGGSATGVFAPDRVSVDDCA